MADLAPIGLQLYSLREELKVDFEATVRKVAEIGYLGVEPYGGMPVTAKEAAALFKELDLKSESAHMPIPLGENANAVLDDAETYGVKYLVLPSIDRDLFKTLDGVKEVADRLNQANANAKARGLKFGYHNHYFEFPEIDGVPAYLTLQELVDPEVFMQVDTYWVQVGGYDVLKLIKDLGERAPLLHIKDGPADKPESDMVAVGQGVMDIAAVIAASGGISKWQIVELDRCATDMTTAVAESYKYLTEKGLANGR